MKNTVILLGLILLCTSFLQNNKKENKKELLVEEKSRSIITNSSISLENMPVIFIKRD